MLDINKIRADFPILSQKVNGKPLVYFDNGATSQKPQVVIDAISKSYIINNAYSAQHNFSNGISVGVLNSLSTAGIDDISEIKYTTHGPVAYETERVMKDYPFTKKLLRGGFVAIPHWAGYEHQAKIKVGEWVTDNQTKDACSGTSIAKHINYDIYINNKIAFVDLTKSRCKTDK